MDMDWDTDMDMVVMDKDGVMEDMDGDMESTPIHGTRLRSLM